MAEASTSSSGSTSLHRIAPLRGTENYNVWRIQMEDILTDLDLYQYVNRSKECPSEGVQITVTPPKDDEGNQPPDETHESTAYAEWIKLDRKALSHIRLRVDGHVLTHIQGCTLSADAWELLASTFQVQGTIGLIGLRRRFFSHRMNENEDIEEHVRKMRDWFQQINDIDPGSCTEIDFITTLVASLPESWDTFTQSINFQFDRTNTNTLANQISDLRARIMAEAHRRSTKNDAHTAFYGNNKPGNNKFKSNTFPPRPNTRSIDKSNTKCNNCGRMGHWAAECRQPGGGAHKNNANNQYNKGPHQNKRFNGPSRGKQHPNRAHIAVDSIPNDDNYAFTASIDELAMISRSSDAWVADSGTTTHIARDRDMFTEYRPSTGTVTGVTGREPILGRGTISLRSSLNNEGTEYTNITLQNVAHVPTCPTNLISLSLVTDEGYNVSMNGQTLTIANKHGKQIATGKKSSERSNGSLWHMNCQTQRIQPEKSNKSEEIVLHKQTGRTWFDWHKILGHIGAQTLQRLKRTNAVEGMEVADSPEGLDFECEACIQAKAHTRPFPKESKSEIKEIGELVVTDVWGPSKVASIGKYRYYVSFTDVATRFTRLGFLRHKDETLNEYKAFEAMVNTQKDKNIKRIRFDNGGEFVNKDWKDHAAKKGTIMETTAPYSSPQNGIAERLNRTLVEKARAMLIEASAPLFLWNEAIAYACYLKNRTPTQVHGQYQLTPYESFWGKKPNISILRPWGTVCYVLNQGERSKLDPKTFKAIFTGISDYQGKSWRYYKKGIPKILHSRNITFPRLSEVSGDQSGDVELGESVVPPAEGEERKEDNSMAKRPVETAQTGGESEVKTEKTEQQNSIKGEAKQEQKSAHTATPPKPKPASAPVLKSSSTRTLMPRVPRPSTTRSMDRLNASGARQGIQTRRSNPNAPAISLEKERGGITIKIEGQEEPKPQIETASFCADDWHDLYADLPSLVLAYPPSEASTESIDELPDLEALTDTVHIRSCDSPEPFHLPIPIPFPPTPPLTPTRVLDDLPTAELNFDDHSDDQAFASRAANSEDTPTVDQALQSPDAEEWRKAMAAEVANLIRLKVFELVPRPPPGTNIIGCQWVMQRKRDENGNISRHKSRVVAKGYTQKPGQDYEDTYAPLVRLDAIRSLLALANHFNWDIRQLDVVSAFLHADLAEELYMEQIPYFSDGTNNVLRLRRSLYGLKQSGRSWNRTLDGKLRAIGYKPLLTDSCIYTRMSASLGILQVSIIAVHVDDLLVITTPLDTDNIIRELLSTFDMRDLGPVRHFLGMQIERERSKRILVLKQTAYIDSIVEQAGQINAYPSDTPISPTTVLTKHEGQRPDYPYATMVGKLMYAALCTRPDIAFAVTYLSQFSSCFGPAHVTAVKRVFRYLKGTSYMGLTYRSDGSANIGELGYSDADWGSNSIDRKSISGSVFLVGGTAVSWSAKKQATVALSTMEAEYMAISQASTQALWLRQFFSELCLTSNDPTTIASDNLAALTLTTESQYHARSKHIDIRHHFVRDAINNGQIRMVYVPTQDNLADALTKALPTPRFDYLVGSFMGQQVFMDEDDYLWN